MKIFLERERVHVPDEKSIPASKIEVSYRQWTTLFQGQFILGSYLIPIRFLAPMASSKIEPQCLSRGYVWLCWRAYTAGLLLSVSDQIQTYKIA